MRFFFTPRAIDTVLRCHSCKGSMILWGVDAGDQLFGEHMMCVANHFLGDQVSVRGVIWSKC